MNEENNDFFSAEVQRLESAVSSALVCFQNRDFANALPYLREATEICELYDLIIPNLFLIKAYSEMNLGMFEEALVSINIECDRVPENVKALELRRQIEEYLNQGTRF